MEGSELHEWLNAAAESGRHEEETDGVVHQLKSSGAKIESVAVILRFMEAHPAEDYGSPGPLVHFMEGFFQRGYEEELLRSLHRQPTPHTVWMLNRLINGQKEMAEREQLLGILHAIHAHPLADEETKEKAQHFYEHQQR